VFCKELPFFQTECKDKADICNGKAILKEKTEGSASRFFISNFIKTAR